MHGVEPDAEVILYGSYARGEENEDSDIDLLVLVDRELSYADQKRIWYLLFDLGFDTGMIISPVVYSKKQWQNKYNITPFYENVQLEGIAI